MSHYNQDYFSYQKPIGEFGGWANKTKFDKYIKETDTVVDFGCGGGYLLNNIVAARKIGVEVNVEAIKQANLFGVEVYTQVSGLKFIGTPVDVIISNHALEHVKDPLNQLIELKKILKVGGLIIFVVPSESVNVEYKPGDVNQHLYTWSPMCLGNLFTQAGFTVLECKEYAHRWPPNYLELGRQGREIFDKACEQYAKVDNKMSQVRIVGING